MSSSHAAKLLMIGGVEKNPGPAHVPDAAVSKDKGDPADKGETMPGRDASSGGPLIAVPPWEVSVLRALCDLGFNHRSPAFALVEHRSQL